MIPNEIKKHAITIFTKSENGYDAYFFDKVIIQDKWIKKQVSYGILDVAVKLIIIDINDYCSITIDNYSFIICEIVPTEHLTKSKDELHTIYKEKFVSDLQISFPPCPNYMKGTIEIVGTI